MTAADSRMRRGVRFKVDHRLVAFGVAQFFARQPLDGFRIVPQRINLRLEFLRCFRFKLQLVFQPQIVAAHPFILMDERQIAHADEQQNGQDDQRDDHFRQRAPDAEVHVHAASKSVAPRARKLILLSARDFELNHFQFFG